MENKNLYLNNSLLEIANSRLNLQDMALLGIREEYKTLSDVNITYLNHIRLDLQRLYFNMKREKETLTQKEADLLNRQYQTIQTVLDNEHGFDSSADYWIEFDYLVPNNKDFGMKICGE